MTPRERVAFFLIQRNGAVVEPALTIRFLHWPEEALLLAGLDTSFTTDRIYRVERTPLQFTLVEVPVEPPLRKEYGPIVPEEHPTLAYPLLAERSGVGVGFAAANYESWNRRLVLEHLYVAPEQRGTGIGRMLVEHLTRIAPVIGARCLWLETQNLNYPAIQFYQRLGFHLCGLDESLYDPAGPVAGEIALYFTRAVE